MSWLSQILIGVTIFAADQGLKLWSAANFQFYQKSSLLGSWVYFTRIANEGLMGDRMSALNPEEAYLYTRYLPSFFIAALLALAAFRHSQASNSERTGYALLIGAGASNLADHWRLQYVLDVLQVYLGGGQYMPCNLADFGITLAVFLAAAGLLREQPRVDNPISRVITE